MRHCLQVSEYVELFVSSRDRVKTLLGNLHHVLEYAEPY